MATTLGRAMSAEQRAKISAALKGRPKTAAHIAAAAAGLRGNKNRLGHITSPETRQRMSDAQKGSRGHNWQGGVSIRAKYRVVCVPGHPYGNRGRVLEHRLVMERVLGRYLLPIEQVHHLDRNKLNNAACNLILCADAADHIRRFHGKEK